MAQCLAPIGPANEFEYPPRCPNERLEEKKNCKVHSFRDEAEFIKNQNARLIELNQ